MSRLIMLGNGSLTVGLNEQGLVHDFYYPYVGLDNLTTARSVHHNIGVWVDGVFSWVDSSWQVTVDFENDALISNISMVNASLQVELHCVDFVDNHQNIFGRNIQVKNLSDSTREIRIFLHQVFQISRDGRADTALYQPDGNYILDYKGRFSLLIYAQSGEKSFDQYAVGSYGIEGKAGTYMDAEDGELSGSAVEHGGVDSVLRITQNLKSQASFPIEYWVIASDSQYNADKIHRSMKKNGLMHYQKSTRKFWKEWLDIAAPKIDQLDPKYQNITKKSLLLIKSHIDKHGGIIASCDSSIYNYGRDYYSYVWPRDGAFAIWPLIRLGYTKEPKLFLEFCRDIISKDGYMMHKYQPDKAIGSTWHPLLHNKRSELGIQEDETASIIFMLGEYCRYSKDYDFAHGMYDSLIRPAANFMGDFMDAETQLPHASYDLWEEKFLTSTYSTAIVYRSLVVAAWFAHNFGHADDHLKWEAAAKTILDNAHTFYDEQKGYYIKGYLLNSKNEPEYDTTLDISSLYGVTTFGLLKHQDIQKINSTVKMIEKELLDVSPSGGTGRYTDDNYFKSDPPYRGNPWIVTTMWMAQFYVHVKKPDKAQHYIDWAIKNALPSGVLSEQINPTSSQPTSVAPLVWSHAELINTILDYSKIK